MSECVVVVNWECKSIGVVELYGYWCGIWVIVLLEGVYILLEVGVGIMFCERSLEEEIIICDMSIVCSMMFY